MDIQKRENKTKETRSGGMAHIFAGGDYKNCAQCGISHFIPNEKEICLGCIGKNIFAGQKLK